MRVLAYNIDVSKTDWSYDLYGEDFNVFFNYVINRRHITPDEIKYWGTSS